MGKKPDIAYWDEKMETLGRDELAALQFQRLMSQLRYLRDRSSFYRKKLGNIWPDIQRIQDLDDFRRIVPFTKKAELREERERSGDPFAGLLCVAKDEVVFLTRTAGTTGTPRPHA